jgi:hypothetical protein
MWRGCGRMWCRRSGPMWRRIQSRGLGRRCGHKRLGLGRHGRDGMRCRRGARMHRLIRSCGLGRRYGRNRLGFGVRGFCLGSATRRVLFAGGGSERPSVGRICTRRRNARQAPQTHTPQSAARGAPDNQAARADLFSASFARRPRNSAKTAASSGLSFSTPLRSSVSAWALSSSTRLPSM